MNENHFQYNTFLNMNRRINRNKFDFYLFTPFYISNADFILEK